jgi:hypothetical protein
VNSTVSPTTTQKVAAGPKALTDPQAENVLYNISRLEAASSQTGWVEIPFAPGPDLCGLTAPDATVEKHFLGARSEGGTTGVVIHSAVLTYATMADLNANVDVLKQAATSCPNPGFEEAGVKYKLSFSDFIEQSEAPFERAVAFGLIATPSSGFAVSNIFGMLTIGRSAVLMQYQVFGRFPNEADSGASVNALTILGLNFAKELS